MTTAQPAPFGQELWGALAFEERLGSSLVGATTTAPK